MYLWSKIISWILLEEGKKNNEIREKDCCVNATLVKPKYPIMFLFDLLDCVI